MPICSPVVKHQHSLNCLCGLTINARRAQKNPLRIDPSRTVGIQRKFMAEMKARFRALRAAMWRWVVMDDELGLGKEALPSITKNAGTYKFATNPKKLIGFGSWLQGQIDRGLLATDAAGGSNWTEKYIYSAYKQGIVRAYSQVNGTAPVSDKDKLKYEGGKAQFIRDSFNLPERQSTVEILATRAYNELDGVTATMGQQMNRILSEGLINGDSPYTIAQEMSSTIEDLGDKRALLIARTETAYAQAQGQLTGFRELGVKELGLLAEVLTAEDDRVCEECQDLADKGPYAIEDAGNLIPAHPNCVLGNSVIESPDALAITRSTYYGKLFRVTTRQGNIFTVTKNHILLTQSGWRFAKELSIGDKLFDAASIDRAFLTDPNNNHGKLTIENTFNALVKSFPENLTTITSTLPEYFHGDGSSMNQKIDIIFADSKLRNQSKIEDTSEFKKFDLMSGNISSVESQSLDSQSFLSQFLKRCASASDSFMCSQSIAPILNRTSFRHHQSIGLSDSSNGNSSPFQSGLNSTSRAVETFSNRVFTLSGIVASNEIIDIEILPATIAGVFVFDIWSHSSIYVLNGILSSNCRCAFSPILAEDTPPADET